MRVYTVAIILVLGICVLSTPALALISQKGDKQGEGEEKKNVEEASIWIYEDSVEDDWTLVHDGRSVKAYPDLREYVWEKVPEHLPNGPFDKIGLHRVVKAGIEPKGVIFICPGTWSSGEQMCSNPLEDPWTVYENYSLPRYLANRDFDVYAIDYRTHFVPIYLEAEDLAFMADWGWDQWLSDIKEAVDLAEEVSGAKRIYIAGESFGGGAAMNFASRYWEEDLKGIILLDGGTGSKYPELVTNTYNLPAMLAGMVATGEWSWEVGESGSLFVMKYADAYPDAPAEFPLGTPLEPTINPFTLQPWNNITEWAAFALYVAWGFGVVTNIYQGFGDPRVMIHINANFDRYWPMRLNLESAAIRDWDNCPDVTYDFDDHFCEIDVPLIAFASELFGIPYMGSFRHGIANPDFTAILLPGFGHLDVYSGEYSEIMVSIPTYEWLMSHRMLIGSGIVKIDGDWNCGKITIYINASVIDLKINDVRKSWDIDCHKSRKKREIYKGDKITIIIINNNLSIACGRNLLFFGCLV